MTPRDRLASTLQVYLPKMLLYLEQGQMTLFNVECEIMATDLLLITEQVVNDFVEAHEERFDHGHNHTWMYDDQPGWYRCDCGETFIERN